MEVAEGIAKEVLREIGVSSPVDARELCEACGVEVRGWRYDFGMRCGDAIWYPRCATFERRQFIVAHELGHWLLEDYGLDPANEERANRIAAALLMPGDRFRDSARGSSIRELAACYGVRQTAAALRLGETRVYSASIVETPSRIYVRGAGSACVERLDAKYLAKVVITDDPGRTAWLAS